MSGHTKGPWSLDEAGDVVSGENLICISAGENYGQWRDVEDGGKSEFEANARLIAAAPELLQAVIACWAVLHADQNYEDSEVKQMAKAAFEKATQP